MGEKWNKYLEYYVLIFHKVFDVFDNILLDIIDYRVVFVCFSGRTYKNNRDK